MTKTSQNIINRLKANGYDIHKLKNDIGADAKHDIFQNKNGDLFVNLKMALANHSRLALI